MKLTKVKALPALSRVKSTTRQPLTVGLVQTRWHSDAEEHLAALNHGIRIAAEAGAQVHEALGVGHHLAVVGIGRHQRIGP